MKTRQALSVKLLEGPVKQRMEPSIMAQFTHDIRSPLNALLNIPKLLRADMQDPEQVERMLTLLERATERLNNTSQVMLSYFRYQSGEPRPTQVTLHLVTANDVGQNLTRDLPWCSFTPAEPHVSLRVDLPRLQQALIVLAGFALKNCSYHKNIALQVLTQDIEGAPKVCFIVTSDTKSAAHLHSPADSRGLSHPELTLIKDLIGFQGGALSLRRIGDDVNSYMLSFPVFGAI